MPLLTPEVPAPALRSVLAALASPAAVREARTPALRAHQGPLTPGSPLPLHVLDGVGAGRKMQAAAPRTRLAGWRFQIRGTDSVVATAEAMLTPDGWAFSHFVEGPYVTSTERALRQAESYPLPVQPRLLSIPELYMLTLWLHAGTAADPAEGRLDPADVLVPLAPAPPGIAAHQPHRAGDLVPVLTHRLSPAGGLLRTTACVSAPAGDRPERLPPVTGRTQGGRRATARSGGASSPSETTCCEIPADRRG
jgi:hypothetical protein